MRTTLTILAAALAMSTLVATDRARAADDPQAPDAMAFAVDGRVSHEALDRALAAAARGDGIESVRLLGSACPDDALDLRCLEVRAAIALSRGDAATAAFAGLALASLGSPTQAVFGAEIATKAGAGGQALTAILSREDARDELAVAEWAAPAAIARSRWDDALDLADARSAARHAVSWRISLCAAVGAAQLDKPGTATARLAEASEAGAPIEALRKAGQAVDAAVARAALSTRAADPQRKEAP